jgi:hypothetical protein
MTKDTTKNGRGGPTMCEFSTGSGTVSYETIRQAMGDTPFTMSLTDTDEVRAVVAAVNEGIDGHLEACYCPERGDSYTGGKRKSGKLVLCHSLDCRISPESLPVLLRRLCESESAGMALASDILMVLGFDEYGQFIGREAVGLA